MQIGHAKHLQVGQLLLVLFCAVFCTETANLRKFAGLMEFGGSAFARYAGIAPLQPVVIQSL
jgi:hypothetical protein